MRKSNRMAALRLSWRTRCLLLVLTMQLFVVVHSRKTSLLNIRENFEDKHAPWYSGPRRKLLQCEPCPSNAEEICSAADSAMEIRTTLISACGSSNIDERCCSLFQQSNWPVLKACACSSVIPGLSSFVNIQDILQTCCDSSSVSEQTSTGIAIGSTLESRLGFNPFARDAGR